MPRRLGSPPKLCRHPNGQAVIYINGGVRYLGRFGTAQANERYRAFVVEWAMGRLGPLVPPNDDKPRVAEVVTVSMAMIRFWEWAEKRYRHPDGGDTREAVNYRYALRPLRKLHGGVPLDQLGPNRLREVQQQMIREGLARKTVNRRIGRIRYFIKWCVGRELCPPSVYEAIRHVEPIPAGQGVRESPGRAPVEWETVEKTLPYLSPLMRAFVLVLWYTGARVGEIRQLTTSMIDRSGDVWVAELDRHKTSHHGKRRVILIGAQAQDALSPWLVPDKPDVPVFSPRRADSRSAVRRGPKAPGRVYDRCAPAHAILRACRKAGIEPWTLASLRHSAATRLREQFGLDVAQVVLGHTKPTMTAHYSASAINHAIDAIRQAG